MSLSQALDFDQAISALDGWLRSRDYTQRAREGIARHIRREGELSGAVGEFLDREHIEPATEILVESLPPVAYCSEEWADEACWTPSDDIDGPDAPDEHVTRQPGYREALERDGITPLPVSGGAPEPTPFTPSEADWADYREWTEWVDRLDSLPDEDGE